MHPAIEQSIASGGEPVVLRRCPADWREIRDAACDCSIDRDAETTTYRGPVTDDDRYEWDVVIRVQPEQEG